MSLKVLFTPCIFKTLVQVPFDRPSSRKWVSGCGGQNEWQSIPRKIFLYLLSNNSSQKVLVQNVLNLMNAIVL